jgi:phosphoribosylglycinamide formyltransferase-1
MSDKKKIAVLVSGGGTNLQALIDAQQQGAISHGQIELVLSSRPDAYALTRAKTAGIACAVLCPSEIDLPQFDAALEQILTRRNIDYVVLAGFMTILGERVLDAYRRRILNVHPSLIPDFCGRGFYGLRVHRAVLQAGVTETGATVHFVNEVVDGGDIIMQKRVAVLPQDTPESLQRRVMEQAEWVLLPKAVELVCSGQVQ